ncbi:hypothetical protein [Stutzerimonas stutzeri]|uniref:hypothetical protein n=2 Tax=Stutzerimonas stutzeri TaxID=316 RepID=UPI0018D74914|nr:hypothetical protein [Stutzerimonas stutzeri]MBH3353606.1 hypothetical protein [Stutzerimonas stutzeri]
MEAVTTRIFIPSSPDNLHVVTSMAAEDPELRAAMTRDAKEGKTFAGYVSRAKRSARANVITGGVAAKYKIDTRDSAAKPKHTESMNDITRNELDAKLDATNARVEARLAAFESTVREAMAAARQDSADMKGELKVIHNDLAGLKNLKANIWGAAGAVLLAFLASALTIYFGIASNNQMLVSNAIAGFGAGKDVSAAQAEIKQLNREAIELLQQIKTQQAAQPIETAPAAPQK